MTHDELTARLRSADHDNDPGWPAMNLAANRLDRYRDLLNRAFLMIGVETGWPDEAQLLGEINEAIK